MDYDQLVREYKIFWATMAMGFLVGALLCEQWAFFLCLGSVSASFGFMIGSDWE